MTALLRAVMFFGLWCVIAGRNGLVVGAFAATAATWASLRLMPPGRGVGSLRAAAVLAMRTVAETVAAGIDIAARAFHPRLPIRPGFVVHQSGLAPGPARDGFAALASLAPGALPAGTDASGALVVHALDTRLPVAAGLAATEVRFARASGAAPAHG